jgi:tetratricopeptide (TPR) repeat protein
MRKPIASLAAALLMVLFAGRDLHAQAQQARVYGVVKDDQGNAIEGARIVLTDPSAAAYRLEALTDKKGKYSLVILDATRTLNWRIEKAGFQALDSPRKVPAGGSTKVDLVLYPAGTAAGDLAAAAATAKNREEFEAAKKAAEAKAGAVDTFNAAVPLFNAGDLDGALAKLQEAVGLDPGLAPAHYVMGKIYERKGMLPEAIAAAEKAVELNGEDARALVLRYDLYQRAGDAAKAQEALAALTAKAPAAAAKALYQQGKALFDAGRTKEAKALLEQAVAADPANGRVYYELGLCHVNLNEIPQAKAAFEKFLAQAPDDPEAPMAREMLSALK